jgi:hypothetical protein
VYVGEGFVCEATIKGVVVSKVIDLFEKHSVRFRRHEGENRDVRFKIAIAALRQISKPYGFKSILKLISGGSVAQIG